MLYWEKHDYDKGLHRWYSVTYGRDLLGDLVLIRSWGGIGRRGHRKKNLLVTTDNDLRDWLHRIGLQRDAEGYALEVRPSFPANRGSGRA